MSIVPVPRLAVPVVLVLIALAGMALAQDALAQDDGQRKKPFSPLHDFLGIDPETGAFVDPETAPDRRPDDGGSNASDTTARSANAAQDGEATDAATAGRQPGQPGRADWPRDAEAAAQAVQRVADRLNEGGFGDLTSLLDDRTSTNRLANLTRQFAWITAALLMLYPLGIVVSETVGWWFHRHETGLTELDRRYQRTRLRRRLLLAAAMIGLILIGTWGSLNGYWWDRPELFTLFWIAVFVFGIAAASLASLIKRSAGQYSFTLIREMRREQLEMRADLDELCKRMRQVTMTSD